MSSNPFVIGQWVRGSRYYGRAGLLEEILHGHRNWVWVLGTRRIGKTSLLKQLEHLTADPSSSGYFPLFWDFQGAEESADLREGFLEALLDAEERLEALEIDPGGIEDDDLFRGLGRLRRALRSQGLKLLLLCDEVEELIKLDARDPSLLRKLRRAMQSTEDIRSVMVSTIRLWALSEQRADTSPFLHGFAPPLYIQRLVPDESRGLIRQTGLPVEQRPSIDDDAVERIRRTCDDHPYLVQLVSKRLLECGSLDEAIEQVATDPMVSHFFAVDFDMLSESEQEAIRIIAASSPSSSNSIRGHLQLGADALSGLLHRLERLGYLRRNAEQRFELVNHFFRRWFRERCRPDSAPPLIGGRSGPSTDPEAPTHVPAGALGTLDRRYELRKELGAGATGVVYSAFDTLLKEQIAIKVLKPEFSRASDSLERFRREMLVARDLNHPNILRNYHLGDCEVGTYITMKLVAGPTLDTVLGREGPLGFRRLSEIAGKLASALEAAHGEHVIHRDIKPQNILMEDDEPFLTDFGLARLRGEPGLTQAGMFVGTPYYAAPEQVRLQRIDERADVYSLGVVIFEMSTGRKPFVADSAAKVLEMQVAEPVPEPGRFRDGMPDGLSALIARCLEKEPERRYPSAAALRRDLGELWGGSSAAW
jgi:tRNA A-37 threonylcarbamoyl transferase component Bud32